MNKRKVKIKEIPNVTFYFEEEKHSLTDFRVLWFKIKGRVFASRLKYTVVIPEIGKVNLLSLSDRELVLIGLFSIRTEELNDV